jgi:MoaA/NifB/PqqE/SkfB family radical SAM enzyme
MIYNIDIVGTCNLLCPSCPVGNHKQQAYGSGRKGGFMDIQMFKAILEKIATEDSGNVVIQLYNWGEPLLHPKYAEIVKLVMDKGWFCAVSSNLSHENVDMRMVAKNLPNHLRISLSGFFQDVYTRGHRSGHVSLVKSNLHKLHYFIAKYSGIESLNKVEVCYHVYRDNVDNNISNMYFLCQELGFSFAPVWAYMMPLEGMIDAANGNVGEDIATTSERMVISLQEMLVIAKQNTMPDCQLRVNQVAINHDGSVALCCGVYDEKNNISPSFLQTPRDELQKLKYQHELCKTCMEKSFHTIGVYNGLGEWNRIGNEKLSALNAPFVVNQYQEPRLANRV